MKILIYLASTTRRSVPRVGGFLYNEEHQKYLYGGKALDAEEANEAAQACLDKPVRNLGHTVTFRVIPDAEETPVTLKKQEAAPEAPPAPVFTIVGDEILRDGEKVAGFTDPDQHLRMTRGNSHLREEVENFLNNKE